MTAEECNNKMKNALGNQHRLEDAEEWMSNVEDGVVEIIQTEQQK